MSYHFQTYNNWLVRLALLAVLVFCIILKMNAQEIDYRTQSLFIYKFTRYITWPQDKANGDFRIGVFGNSPILHELDLMASLKKAANEADIVVKEISAEDDLSSYNIIYVPSSRSRQIGEIIELTKGKPVLIVAEREGMAGKGATISFLVMENEVLRFEINMSNMEEQHLQISDELLKLGFKV
jgi:hypothetical protein